MGIFDRLFGRKPEQPTAQKVGPSSAGETLEEQKKQKPAPQVLVDYDKLIDELVAQIPLEPTPIGNLDPICPYCGVTLPKMPKRTIKCPSCGNKIRLETRPYDGQRVLATLQQAEEIWFQQWRQSDAYQERIAVLKQTLLRHQMSGIAGWEFLAVLDEVDKPEFVRFHGATFKFGSKGEINALKLMVRPDSRCSPIAFFDDPDLDTNPVTHKKHRDEWFEKRGLSR